MIEINDVLFEGMNSLCLFGDLFFLYKNWEIYISKKGVAEAHKVYKSYFLIDMDYIEKISKDYCRALATQIQNSLA
jgi:hypothetical protein